MTDIDNPARPTLDAFAWPAYVGDVDDDRATTRCTTPTREGAGSTPFSTPWCMTEPQAGIGRAPIAKLASWNATRNRNAGTSHEHLRSIDTLRVARPRPRDHHAYERDADVRLEAGRIGGDRDHLSIAYSKAEVLCKLGSASEIYREPAFARAGFGPSGPLPATCELTRTTIVFEVDPGLGDPATYAIGRVVTRTTEQATR